MAKQVEGQLDYGAALPPWAEPSFIMSIRLEEKTVKPGDSVVLWIDLTNTSGLEIQLLGGRSRPNPYTVGALDNVGKPVPLTAQGARISEWRTGLKERWPSRQGGSINTGTPRELASFLAAVRAALDVADYSHPQSTTVSQRWRSRRAA